MPLIIPKQKPPQLVPAIRDELSGEILGRGLTGVWDTAAPLFTLKHRDLAKFVGSFVFEQDGKLTEDDNPQRAFRIGAILAGLAYYKSGYEQDVDGDAFTEGFMEAQLEGIPDAFLLSFVVDPELQALVNLVSDTPEVREADDGRNYEEIIAIGAGCTRYHLQHAIDLAA